MRSKFFSCYIEFVYGESVRMEFINVEDKTKLYIFNRNDVDWDWETKTGCPFMYPVYGAACSEVEVDCLTGSHRVLRTDIVIDIGRSLNPAIDIGQVGIVTVL